MEVHGTMDERDGGLIKYKARAYYISVTKYYAYRQKPDGQPTDRRLNFLKHMDEIPFQEGKFMHSRVDAFRRLQASRESLSVQCDDEYIGCYSNRDKLVKTKRQVVEDRYRLHSIWRARHHGRRQRFGVGTGFRKTHTSGSDKKYKIEVWLLPRHKKRPSSSEDERRASHVSFVTRGKAESNFISALPLA